ncbi:hypothetical protein GS885_17395 [Rhodococcus hoagii]|nr:hypothetical protein [Prescottella equi]
MLRRAGGLTRLRRTASDGVVLYRDESLLREQEQPRGDHERRLSHGLGAPVT